MYVKSRIAGTGKQVYKGRLGDIIHLIKLTNNIGKILIKRKNLCSKEINLLYKY